MKNSIAILWDESYLWALWMHDALGAIGAKSRIITSKDVRAGELDKFTALAVPGGWASNKIKALGDDGAEAILDFVNAGGKYMGICGGAGLATSDGLGLVGISRKPTKERVPSLSGPVKLTLNSHPAWDGIQGDVFHIWWPSQFSLNDSNIKVLASFQDATADTYSSDIRVGAIPTDGWTKHEEAYGLNLNPARMTGEPVVVEASYGKGSVILSLVHLDTPGDMHGQTALANICRHMGVDTAEPVILTSINHAGGSIYHAANRLYEFGIDKELWFRRGSITQWKRGVRGLEYFTLISMIANLGDSHDNVTPELELEVETFVIDALELLELEHKAIISGQSITFKKSTSPRMEELRTDLFSLKKSHGGRFKDLLMQFDTLLLSYYRSLR